MADRITIRRADPGDFGQITSIYAYARTFMAENGNAGQWGNHFPPDTLIREDIAQGRLYVVEDEKNIHGVFAFIIGKDDTYAVIEDGAWLSDSLYGTIHRMAGDGKIHGIFHKTVKFCGQKIRHLRIDTHEDNKIMQHLIEKNGFRRCGKIYVGDGTPRLAYERI